MSNRPRRLAHVIGFTILCVSLAALASRLWLERGDAGAVPAHAQVFVPTDATLPSHDEEPAPTF